MSLRVTNEETGVTITANSSPTGDYRISYLIPGRYRVEAEMAGFSKLVRSAIQVRTTETVTLDLPLAIGEVSEVVEVTSETPLLEVSDVNLGQVVDQRRIEELPLFAGNAMDLVHLAPGTVNGTNLRLRKAPFNNAPSQFGTNGVSNYNNDFTIDGVVNVYSDGTQPRVAFSPPQTAIGEFKVQTSSFDASSGFSLGSVVNVTTKSGTNTLRGEVHHWLRHSKLDSPTIFQRRSGTGVPLYQDNRFGGSVGGPLYIPKVYDGRNRTFWFYAIEANLFGDPNVGSRFSTVPTDEMRRGDLSPLLALSANNQVYDPLSTTPAPNGRFRRTPIADNRIPNARLDPVAQNLLRAWPSPNRQGTDDFRQNFFLAGKALETYWTNIGRVDHVFSENHRIFFRFHRDYWEEDKNRWYGPDFVDGIILNRINRGAALDDVIVLSPSVLLNFRYGLTQQEFPERRVSQGQDLAALGFSSQLVNAVDRSVATFPRLAVAPWSTASGWESGDGVTASLIHNFNTTVSINKSKHSIRIGFDWRNLRENRNRFPQQTSPDLSFNSTFTRGELDSAPPPQVGGEIASFLLGIPAGSMAVVASYAERNSLFGFYLQDDIKVSRKLTLNIGLRYEVENATTERFNRSVRNFAETAASPIEAQAQANYARNPIPELAVADFRVRGGLTFVGVGSNPRGYWNPAQNNLMPRIGLAYQLNDKTVFRGGYGIFFAPLGTLYTNTEPAGFTLSTPIQASLDNGLTFLATTANPFPNGLLQPLGADGGLMTNIGQNVTAFPDSRKNAYAQRWSAGFQRTLPAQFLVEASYVGNRSTRLNVLRNMNFTPGEFLSTSPVRDQATIDFLARNFPSPFRGTDPIFGANMSRANLLRPFPQFNAVNIHEPVGYGWYHSLQMRLEKRFTKSYTAQMSYTWSKNMEATEFMNLQDPTPYEVVSALDRTHRVTASGIWEIPYGKGRQFGGNLHPVVDGIFGGWQFSSSWQHQSGQPLGFGNAIFNGDLKNVVLPSDQRSVDQWFNPNAGFVIRNEFQLASNLRRFPLRFSGIRGPVQDRLDFGLIKNFRISERFVMQFRAETFNALDFANLANPNTTVTSGAFGTITSQDPPRSWQGALKLSF
ncbi:MAG: carboxypeptidase-like regulatory domain-containing protein [Bryobacterales bacterium]|nr:carboxypeptidase-like regulatory domain-containing protein [Bryobacterales bacterium]